MQVFDKRNETHAMPSKEPQIQQSNLLTFWQLHNFKAAHWESNTLRALATWNRVKNHPQNQDRPPSPLDSWLLLKPFPSDNAMLCWSKFCSFIFANFGQKTIIQPLEADPSDVRETIKNIYVFFRNKSKIRGGAEFLNFQNVSLKAFYALKCWLFLWKVRFWVLNIWRGGWGGGLPI